MFWQVLHHSFRGALHNELGHDGACHGHDRRDRKISLVSGADEAHPSVLLRPGPATVPQAQELRGVSSLLMMQEKCTLCSVTWYLKRNRSLFTCVYTSLESVAFLVPPGATRSLTPAKRRKWRTNRLPDLRVVPCCSATLLKVGRMTHAEIGTLASPTRSHFSHRTGINTSQASRGSRPSLFSSSHRRSVCVDRHAWNTCGSHAVKWSLTVLLSHPCKKRSSA